MSKKLKKLENIFLVIVAIIIMAIMLDGYKIYTLSENKIPDNSYEQISEIMIDSKNIDLIKTKKINNSILYLYKVDNTYASLIYNRSLFYNRYKLETATYNINTEKTFTEAFSNQLYNNIYSINNTDNKVSINNTKQLNYKLFQTLVFIAVGIVICFFGLRKFFKSNSKNDSDN